MFVASSASLSAFKPAASLSKKRDVRLCLAFLAVALGCNNPTIATPIRTLDRPSDVALYCVDLEVPNCLPCFDSTNPRCNPQINPDIDPQAYLDAYCDQSTVDFSINNPPTVNVLTLDECDQDHRAARENDYLAAVYKAARRLGRDPNYPCCPGDNTACGQPVPICARRMLSALITNTTRGELAVADTQTQTPGLQTYGRLENLHGGQPGFGFLPVGLLPEHVRSYSPPADRNGPSGRHESPNAWAVTANGGSCDLSVVRLQPIAELAAQPAVCYQKDALKNGQACPSHDCTAETCPERIVPWLPDSAGQRRTALYARPEWVEIAPWSKERRTAIVAYPTCGIVATVDLGCTDPTEKGCDRATPPGRIWEAVGFDITGQARILPGSELASLQCATDCGADAKGPLMPPPGTPPDGGGTTLKVFPASLAVEAAGQRLLISDSLGDSVTFVDFDGSNAVTDEHRLIGTPRRLRLDFDVLPESLRGGQRGLDSIRISPRTPAGQFAYVVARDSSVRVIDLDREIECETNPDPRYLQAHAGDIARVLPDELNDSNARRLSCFPVQAKGAAATPRNPLAVSPGITLPNGSLPRDIGFVHSNLGSPCDVSDPINCRFAPNALSYWLPASTALWLGDFAWILGGGGVMTGIQIADACPAPSYRACFPDFAALRRVVFLYTRSQAQPSPEILSLPSYYQSLMVSPNDRLGNVRRTTSRFDETNPIFGPRSDSDASGLPIFSTVMNGAAVGYYGSLNDGAIAAGRPRLLLPAPTPYYYLPVDPVCDVALASHAVVDDNLLKSPDGFLAKEPTGRPVSMVQFIDTASLPDSFWSFDWEGLLPGLNRSTGRLLVNDGTTDAKQPHYASLQDLNGLYCSHGTESGDKLWLTGCQADTDCLDGSICRREATQGINPGICLTDPQASLCRTLSQRLLVDKGSDTVWAASWLRRYRIMRAEQQVMTPTGDISDRLILDEIPEPEFELERQSCSQAGSSAACTGAILLPGRAVDVQKPPPQLVCRVTGKQKGGNLEMGCIRECQRNLDCGDGFVCAHSRYETDEKAIWMPENPKKPIGARCVRAPLIHPDTPQHIGNGDTWQPMGEDAANALLRACFPDLSSYEVHAGDSFVARGDHSGTNILVQRDKDGICRRPPPGDRSYAAGRLLEPRLRLGPRDSLPDNDAQRCPSYEQWISHRIAASAEAVATPSCQSVRNVDQVQLPASAPSIKVVHGDKFLPPKKDDPWLSSEYELLASLPLGSDRNQCILSGSSDEDYPDTAAVQSCYNPQSKPDKICRFPGDHTESLGVRRIHYENPYGNIVLRVPRVLLDLAQPYSDCAPAGQPQPPGKPCISGIYNPAVWSIPPEGYSINFRIWGSLPPYQVAAQSSPVDSTSGQPAQGLRSATMAPSGAIFVVDEGRDGSIAGLRGQVLRFVGGSLDPIFLLR